MYAVTSDYPESPAESEVESITDESIDTGEVFQAGPERPCFPSPRESTSGAEKQKKWAVKTFTQWCATVGVTKSLEDLSQSELNSLLKKFYKDARRKDGCSFSRTGLNNIRTALDKYVKSHHNYSIVKTSEFAEANEAFDSRVKELENSLASPWRLSVSISPQDMQKLLQSGAISGSSPILLLNACWFNVLLHFRVGDHVKQRKLSKQQFMIHVDDRGKEYVKMTGINSDATMQSVPGHPLCPVTLLKKYLSKLHPEFDVLFQRPVQYKVDDTVPVWYEKQAIGIHTLEVMMAKISKEAGLSRVYTNVCLNKSSSLVYIQCGFGLSPATHPKAPAVASSNQGTANAGRETQSTGTLSVASAVASFTQGNLNQGQTVSKVMSVLPPTSTGFSSVEQSHECVGESDQFSSPLSAYSTGSCHSESGISSFDNLSPMDIKISPRLTPSINPIDFGPVPGSSRTAIGICMPTIKQESASMACDSIGIQPSFPGESLDLPSLTESLVVRREPTTSQTTHRQPSDEPPTDLQSKTYLRLDILGGFSFMDCDQFGQQADQESSTITLHLHFRGQRFKSKPVACCSEPRLNEGFYLEVMDSNIQDARTLLSITDPVHFIIAKTESSGYQSLIGSCYFDWQPVLKELSWQMSCNVDVHGLGEETKIMIGRLQIRIGILPHPQQPLPCNVVESHMSNVSSSVTNRDRRFMAYARQWWREYMSSSPAHNRTQVKIFAQDECDSSRPVVSFVRPIQTGWTLDTPRHAARFISLLPHEEECSMFGGRVDRWTSLPVFLCRGKGSSVDHALLLCSILLGFGLEAFVCLGTRGSGQPHTWVMTRNQNRQMTFWESLTGQRFELSGDAAQAVCTQYRTVSCVFNNSAFYANIQTSGLVSQCNWDFSVSSNWKTMSTEAISSICGPSLESPLPLPPSLISSSIDVPRVSREFQEQLKLAIQEYRKGLGLPTEWDNVFAHLLSPTLAAYETQACTGLAQDNDELRGPILRALGDTLSLISATSCFSRLNVSKAFAEIQQATEYQALIGSRTDHVTLAVQVKVFPYPEGACAVWVVIAAMFLATEGHVVREWKMVDLQPLLN